jgi:hypothetical protein
VDRNSFYVQGDEVYYPFKKELTFQSREDFKTKISERINAYVANLRNNATFGENKNAEYQINVTIKGIKDILRKLDFNTWSSNKQDVTNTYFYRNNKPLDSNINPGEYEKFLKDEQIIALLDTKVKNEKGEWVEELPDYLVFGDKIVADGTYSRNSYLDKLDVMFTSLSAKQKIIEDELTQYYIGKQLSNPLEGGLGFKPTIRNVFAIILAGADAFYRLMDENHEEAWNVRTDKNRLLAVIPSDKNFSVDALKSIQTSSTELNSDNVVYPWPLYFTLEKQDNGSDLYTIQYPGDAKYIRQTKAYDYRVWPEVGFVEAFIKATLEKSKPEVRYSYDNPKDVTKYVSCNAIEFPFKTAPYQDLDAIKTFYEIFERTYIASHYGNLPSDIASSKQIDQFYGDIESLNISLVAPSDITINQTLKNSAFNLSKLVDYMKTISNNGQGQSWQTYIRDYFNTDYLKTLLANVNEIYSIDTLAGASIQVSADLPLAPNMKEFLEDSATSKQKKLDVYPFTNVDWLKKYMSNGESIGSYEDYNNTTRSYIFLDDKKTIARINATEKYENLKLFTSNAVFQNNTQPLLVDPSSDDPIDSALSLKEYYNRRQYEDLFLTESFIDYGNSYSGNLGTFIQTTSLMNTPYFVNAILDGVQKQKNNEENPYAALGYMYLNSLPLITTKEKIKDVTNDVVTDLDYLAATFNKFSSIHQVPYAWVLKYGSIWHRYKTYIEKNIDILEDTWKDFDYVFSYDPTTGSSSTKYTILDYSGNPTTISLQNVELYTPAFNVFNLKETYDTGFYPKVINSIEYYLNGKDLITGYTPTDFSKLYTEQGLKIGFNPTNEVYYFPQGYDASNPNKELLKRNLFTYRKYKKNNVDSEPSTIIMYPSMGGIPFDQAIYECFNPQKKITESLYNNNSMYNGTVRSVWGMSQFGYFNNKLIKKPLPTEYLKIIKTNTDKQNVFDITNTESTYSMIDEIFSVFDVALLDKMEEKFLTFCKYKPLADELKLNDENITPNYLQTNGLTNANLKLLKNQIQNLFSYQTIFFQQVNETIDTQTLMNDQISNLYTNLREFLNFDCVLKIGNPTNFDRKLFDSLSTLSNMQTEDKLTFGKYVSGSLPGDGTLTTLLQSTTSLPQSWSTLHKYLGFSLIPGVDYENQVNNAFPSVPNPTSATTATTTNANSEIQLQYIGSSYNIITTPTNDSEYIHIEKTTSGYDVFKIIGEPDKSKISQRLQSISFYQPNSNVQDSSNIVQSEFTMNAQTKYQYVAKIIQAQPGKYQMVVTYAPNLPTSPETLLLIADVSTSPNFSSTIPQNNNVSITPLALANTQKCLVSDFFIQNNIAFNPQNIRTLYPIIRIYVEQKLKDPTFNKNKLITYINDFLTDRYELQDKMVNQTFTKLNKILKKIEVDYGLPTTPMNGDTTKLALYNTLKGFNDKWISGSDLKSVTLFEDFLFMDRSNSDLGNSYNVDLNKVVNRLALDTKQDQSLMSLISSILEDNYFIFMAMPAYINFYGIQKALKGGQPLEDSEIGNSLFGTYLEVDYTQSNPKFLCLYVGNPSEYPKPKENSFNRFGDDSFDLRVPDNPLRVSDPNRNYSLSNRVVGFAVDFGIRNQNIFKGLNLDMSEMKNTSESFKVFADMGSSVSGDKVAQQSQSLYSIYKSRSYQCTVSSMGNAMIQPTMYYILRHVPMFYGPYWITEVNHNISTSGFDTEFKGTRIPKYALPKIDNLMASVNKTVLAELKNLLGVTKTPKTQEVLDAEKLLSTNPPLQTLNGAENVCLSGVPTVYASVPFEPLLQTPFTKDEFIPLLDSVTTNKVMKALLWGIAQNQKSTTNNNGVFNCINYNPFQIDTQRIQPGNLNSFIKKQSCVQIDNKNIRLVKFDTFTESIQFMNAYMTNVINSIPRLVTLNPNTNLDKSYGAALFQLAYTTWYGTFAFGNPDAIPPVPPLNETQIKSKTISDFASLTNNYNTLVESFTQAWQQFK